MTRKAKGALFWDYYYNRVPDPKVEGEIPFDDGIYGRLAQEDIDLEELPIDTGGYRRYMEAACYVDYPDYYNGGNPRGPGAPRTSKFVEKTLEHYLAAKLLQLSPHDVYLDIASANSPAPDIYRKLFGCTVFRNDLTYPAGIDGDAIGGDAGDMPVEDGFATKMALHCSFEHFEGDSDIGFIREASRVLAPGGMLCILPLYMADKYSILTDPVVLPRKGISFEDGATLYCRKGWGNRHGRFYDIPHLKERVLANMGDLELKIFIVRNQDRIGPGIYLRLAALFRKPGAGT
jgi:hypothetical protein